MAMQQMSQSNLGEMKKLTLNTLDTVRSGVGRRDGGY
jgi:hypothetical protein